MTELSRYLWFPKRLLVQCLLWKWLRLPCSFSNPFWCALTRETCFKCPSLLPNLYVPFEYLGIIRVPARSIVQLSIVQPLHYFCRSVNVRFSHFSRHHFFPPWSSSSSSSFSQFFDKLWCCEKSQNKLDKKNWSEGHTVVILDIVL